MLKGAGIGSIVKLTLTVMVASLFISLTTIGSIGEALYDTFDEIGESTDLTTEVDDLETLNDLTVFVIDRSVNEGCDRVDERNAEGGYSGLAGTRLTEKPDCFGAEEQNLATDNLPTTYGDDENQMAGIFSRERYEMTEHVKVNTSHDSEYALQNRDNLMWVTSKSRADYQDFLDEIDQDEHGDGDSFFVIEGIEMAVGIIESLSEWTRRNVPFSTRVIGTPDTDVAGVIVFLNYEDADLKDRSNIGYLEEDDALEDSGELEDLVFLIQFCDGDQGYIQGSRGQVDSDAGVTSEGIVYPTIVIEDAEQDECGDVRGMESYSGPYSGTQIHIKSQESLMRDNSGAANIYKINDEHQEFDSFNLQDQSDRDKCPIIHQDTDSLDLSRTDGFIDQMQDDFHDFASSTVESAIGGTYAGYIASELIDLAMDTIDSLRATISDTVIGMVGTATPDRATMLEYETGETIGPIENGMDFSSPERTDREVGIHGPVIDHTIDISVTIDYVVGSTTYGFQHTIIWPERSYTIDVGVTSNSYQDHMENKGLDDSVMSDPDDSKQLRPQTMNIGYDRTYGEVKCGQIGSNEARWHICTEGFEGRTIGDYECEVEDGEMKGEWVRQ